MGNKQTTPAVIEKKTVPPTPVTLDDVIKYRNMVWKNIYSEEYNLSTTRGINPIYVYDYGTCIVVDKTKITGRREKSIKQSIDVLINTKCHLSTPIYNTSAVTYNTSTVTRYFYTNSTEPFITCNSTDSINDIITTICNNINLDKTTHICRFIIDADGSILCYDNMWEKINEALPPQYSEK